MSNVTDFSRSSPGLLLGAATSAVSLAGVTISSNAAATSGWVLVATGSNSAIWRDAISFGSNTNDVSLAGTMGSSSSNSRADHVHRGVGSISHSSNTYYGSITLQAGSSIAITSPASGTFQIASAAGVGSGTGESNTVWNILPDSDTYINEASPTANYESNAVLAIADRYSSPGGFSKFAILEFSLTDLTDPVLHAALRLHVVSGGNAGIFTGHIGVRRMTRSGIDLTQSTWNVYSTGNNWGTAGGRNVTDGLQVFEGGIQWSSPVNVAAQWITIDITALLRQAIIENVDPLQIMVAPVENVTGSQNPVNIDSLEASDAALRPLLTAVTIG